MKQKDFSFWMGAALILLGTFLLCKAAWVHTGWFGLRIGSVRISDGFATLPLLAGITLILRNPKSKYGYIFSLAGIVLLVLIFLSSMHISFHHTSLFNLLCMMLCISVGISLLIKRK